MGTEQNDGATAWCHHRYPVSPAKRRCGRCPISSVGTASSPAAVQAAHVGADDDIPYLSAALAEKYVADLNRLGVLAS